MKFLILTLLFCTNAFGATVGIAASSVRTLYNGSNVTSTAALLLEASLPYPATSISVFDSSGQTMELQIVSPNSTATLVIIPPGGGDFPLNISANNKISIIGLSGTPSSGTENDINFFF